MTQGRIAGLLAGVGATLLVAQLAAAAPTDLRTSRPRLVLGARGMGSFTPANVDPRLAAAMARSNLTGGNFRFTPSAASVRLNRSVTVAVRARSSDSRSGGERVALVTAPASVGIAPIAYNLGLAVGWKRFALQGEVARVDSILGGRQAVDLGVSYNTKSWSARVAATADAPTSVAPRPLRDGGAGYGVDVGGSYSLTRNIDVTAGLRYRQSERDRLRAVADSRRDSQAVYLGTAFKF